jgi:hypothetical protein
MRIKLTLGVVILTIIGITGSAWAQGYGTAGCGLGAVLFGSKPGAIQIVAATSNGLFANQTFAITTGTSRCGESAAKKIDVSSFIRTNREAVTRDIARGNGETIDNLASIAGCKNSAAVGPTLQKNFSSIVPSAKTKDGEVSKNVITTLRSHNELQCGNLS